MNLKMRFVFVCSAIILLLVVPTGRAGDLKVKENDHIVIVGNTFAERMHLFGYFETFLHSRFPEHRLRIRYLAWPAEEVGEPIRVGRFLGAEALFHAVFGNHARSDALLERYQSIVDDIDDDAERATLALVRSVAAYQRGDWLSCFEKFSSMR